MVRDRGKELTDPAVLEAHGGGDVYPLPNGEIAANGNYLESNEIAKRHGICGDPSSVSVIDYYVFHLRPFQIIQQLHSLALCVSPHYFG